MFCVLNNGAIGAPDLIFTFRALRVFSRRFDPISTFVRRRKNISLSVRMFI